MFLASLLGPWKIQGRLKTLKEGLSSCIGQAGFFTQSIYDSRFPLPPLHVFYVEEWIFAPGSGTSQSAGWDSFLCTCENAQGSNSQLFLDFLENSQQPDFKPMDAGALPDCGMFLRCYDMLCKVHILDTEINKMLEIELCIGRKQIFEKQ